MSRQSADLVRVVAKLYYVDGLDQNEVAELAGFSRSHVSRLLTRAREEGVVRITVDDFDARNRELEDRLTGVFGLTHAIVIRTTHCVSSEVTRRSVGYFAAPYVAELLRPDTVIGVAGGRSVYELVRHMRPTTSIDNVTVVQLMGNLGPNVNNTDAIEISRSLAQHFRGRYYTVNSPALAADADSREVFVAHPDVKTVWQVFGSMDIALVGIGTLTDSLFIARGALDPGEIAQLEATGAIGEICGRFFDFRGQECNTEFRDRVISIGLDELAKRHHVIAVTLGACRSEAVYAALRGALIQGLIVDELGAEAVLARAGHQPSVRE